MLQTAATKSSWDSFKEVVYKGVDAFSEVSSSSEEDEGPIAPPISRVVGGYREDRTRISTDTTPGKKLLEEYQAKALELEQYKKKIAALQYDRSLTPKERAMYALRAEDFDAEEMFNEKDAQSFLDQELSEPAFRPGGPIKFEVDKKILEKEAFARAKRRPDMKVRAPKEDLYNLVDAFKEGVEATPEAFTNVASFVKSVPDRYYEAVEDAKSLQKKVESTAKDVIDLPNKVSRKVQNVKQSVDETGQKLKVLVGAEKPVPKAPKPPTKLPVITKAISKAENKENEELSKRALDATGRIGLGAAKLAFSATKGAVTFAAQQAVKAAGKELPTLPTREKAVDAAKLKQKSKELDIESSKIQEEVADALKFATAALEEAKGVDNNKK